MSEIQALTLRVKELSDSVDFWNWLMLWGLGLAALAAVFVVIATRVVVTRTGQLAVSTSLLSEAKDRQLATDLSGRDLKIGELGAKLETERQNTAKFQREAANAQLELREYVDGLAKQSKHLEERASGRTLTNPEVLAISEDMKKFAGQIFEVHAYWGLDEPKQIGARIVAALTLAGWNNLRPIGPPAIANAGVEGIWIIADLKAGIGVTTAAGILGIALSTRGIYIRKQVRDLGACRDCILIEIGTKPAPSDK